MIYDELKAPYGSYIIGELVITLSHHARLDYILEQGKEAPYYSATHFYQAQAFDQHGREYQIIWHIKEGIDFGALEDEGEACDWKNPYLIKPLFSGVVP